MVELNIALSPRLQTELIGHQSQWRLLLRKFHNNELHPAWLLSGTKGIGKSTFAYQAARYILKANQNNDQFFDTLINQKSHPNIRNHRIDHDHRCKNIFRRPYCLFDYDHIGTSAYPGSG